jgi:ribose transport system permease protein
MCVILIRGFDISVGAVLALASVCAALAIQQFGMAGIAAAPVVGLVVGCVNGVLIGKARVQPVIATLGTMLAARGLALLFSQNGQVIVVTGDPQMQLLDFNFGDFLGLPYATIMTVAIFAAATIFLVYTRSGRRLFLIGGDPEAARLVGVPVTRMTVMAYALCGLCAGFAAVLVVARTGSGLPTDGYGMELQAIAAAVIGGSQLTGGVANPFGVLVAALIIQVVYSGLSFSAISPFAGEIVMGVVILVAGALDRIVHRINANRMKE